MIDVPAECSRVAAFFDLDGTLLPKPSLERRFLVALHQARVIPTKNYIAWLAQAAGLAPQGLETILHGNKMYLRGVAVSATFPPSFPEAIDQAAWHASIGHALVLVSGTLLPLAHRVAVTLSMRLAAHGVSVRVGVCATRLEEFDGRWTGRILGDAMFGVAKARAVQSIAAAERFDLRRCYAYGDSSADRWMLNVVGRPAAVNPSPDLQRTASLNDWPVLRWKPTTKRNKEVAECRSSSHRASVASPGTETHG